MEYSEDMATSIQDLKARHNNNSENLGHKIEHQLDNFDYQPDVIPQSTLQKAPPLRQGQLENFNTHQVINSSNYYPPINRGYIPHSHPSQHPPYISSHSSQTLPPKLKKDFTFIEGILNGVYQRIIDPIILTILFIIFAHRITAKGSNPYLPFVSDSPSTDLVSLGFRGFVVSVLYLIIKSML
ncbi:hypothetical protein crov361 [Cafeteria roenbergensis virus]|uniref:Uncharacterized protein n=1 Tax=Cafeteria roenbergensis virus (strain BV-PW1) TaxID=693272 RepID=E3T5D2_CROVB|nr:hypothetical protein crov361 [Cafeteria roenbergensis virus BV-PW1]ADO67395.1 hypothetical protein crov361 [Cafeteria roenbergensis virus BV-PW1]